MIRWVAALAGEVAVRARRTWKLASWAVLIVWAATTGIAWPVLMWMEVGR